MDKRFEKILNEMNDLVKHSSELNIKVKDLFSNTNSKQNETKELLGKCENELSSLQEKSEKVLNDSKNKLNDEIESMSKQSDETISKIADVEKENTSKVEELLKSVNEKAKEIFTIYDELEKIKKIHNEASQKFGSLADEQLNIINDLKKKYDDLNMDGMPKVVKDIMNDYEKRISKLEKHAHKHTFSGSKI